MTFTHDKADIAGALFDFMGFLTTRAKVVTVSLRHEPYDLMEAYEEWTKARNFIAPGANVAGWNSEVLPVAAVHETPEEEFARAGRDLHEDVNMRLAGKLGRASAQNQLQKLLLDEAMQRERLSLPEPDDDCQVTLWCMPSPNNLGWSAEDFMERRPGGIVRINPTDVPIHACITGISAVPPGVFDGDPEPEPHPLAAALMKVRPM